MINEPPYMHGAGYRSELDDYILSDSFYPRLAHYVGLIDTDGWSIDDARHDQKVLIAKCLDRIVADMSDLGEEDRAPDYQDFAFFLQYLKNCAAKATEACG